MDKLKLFVWEGVLTDYTDGVMFALAETKEEAKDIINKRYVFWCVENDLNEYEPDVYDSKVGFAVFGGG